MLGKNWFFFFLNFKNEKVDQKKAPNWGFSKGYVIKHLNQHGGNRWQLGLFLHYQDI
jgi:formylmethanofuran dehydrogenase subunit A